MKPLHSMAAALGLLAAQDPASAGPADHFAAGVVHYRAGRYEDARIAFQAEALAARARGAAAPDELLANLALAALRVQRTSEAEAAARALAARQDAEARALGEFLLGSAAFQRGERAAAAAQLQDAEPMAWASAVRGVAAALASWQKAAELRGDWPEARRNAERAQRRLAELERLRAAAESRQQAQRRAPEPPPPRPGEAAADEEPPQLPQATLPRGAVWELLARVQQQERAKRALRQSSQRQNAVVGEKDW